MKYILGTILITFITACGVNASEETDTTKVDSTSVDTTTVDTSSLQIRP